MIRVLICDDQDVVREGLRVILGTTRDIQVAGVASNGAEAVELVEKFQPDLVLMDLNMPGMNGIQATRVIRTKFPSVKVLALTTYDADEWVFDAIRAGASGYLLKDSTRREIISYIEGTVEGKTHIDPAVADKLFAAVRHPHRDQPPSTLKADLNERELEILRLLAKGFSNAIIAEKLVLAEGTVRNYVSNLFAKLDVEDRTQAAALAWRHGLVDAQDDPT